MKAAQLLSRLKASFGYQTKSPAVSWLLAISTVSRRAEIANDDICDMRHHECLHLLVHGRDLIAVVVGGILERADHRPAIALGAKGGVAAELVVPHVGEFAADPLGVIAHPRKEGVVGFGQPHQNHVIEHACHSSLVAGPLSVPRRSGRSAKPTSAPTSPAIDTQD